MKIILSVKPEYAFKILDTTKKYEFRRKIFKRNIKIVYVYASYPIKKVVGCFKVGKIINGTPNYIWGMCNNKAGIKKEDYFKYFKGSEKAFAIEIKEIKKFNREYKLKDNFKPPQSFRYLQNLKIILDKDK